MLVVSVLKLVLSESCDTAKGFDEGVFYPDCFCKSGYVIAASG